MGGRCWAAGVLLVTMAALGTGSAFSQSPGELLQGALKKFDDLAAKMAPGCLRMRVSEGVANTRARKSLGRPTAEICQQAAEKWKTRLIEVFNEFPGLTDTRPSGKRDPSREAQLGKASNKAMEAYVSMCRDVGERVAGRPVEIVWCTAWQDRPGQSGAKAERPEEIWEAIDGSPFEGISAKTSSRQERLREFFERRLGKDWDQLQVKADMEGMGFECGVWTPQGKLDRNITLVSPRLDCVAYVSEQATAPSRTLLLFTMQINVAVKYAEPGGPRGWQQIEVRTGEGHL